MSVATAAGWPRIVIVGAGISGICAGIRLRRAGFDDILILEKAERIGGTWRDNAYPGAACDVPSHLYSFSFAPKADWSHFYAGQAEILAYLEDCVARFALAAVIRTGVEVTAARYSETERRWRVELAGGEHLNADIVIMATGQLHRPCVPEIAGQGDFAGAAFHSARWPKGCDPEDRNVAIVGSAASAVQIATALARRDNRITVFQRTPNWVLPRFNPAYSDLAKRLSRVPVLRRLRRDALYGLREATLLAFRSGSAINRLAAAATRAFMRHMLRRTRLADTLTPDYPLGCKRILLAGDYLSLIGRGRVSLATAGISHIVPEGIVTADGMVHPADIIVYATGFRATEFLAPIDVRGRGEARLADDWAEGAEAYLGMTVPRFPNLFMLYGPNTGVGHTSVIFMVECQVQHIVRLLTHMRHVAVAEADVRGDVFRRFNRRMQLAMARRTWSGNCTSWYKDKNGKVILIWPYSTARYWWMTHRPRIADYQLR